MAVLYAFGKPEPKVDYPLEFCVWLQRHFDELLEILREEAKR